MTKGKPIKKYLEWARKYPTAAEFAEFIRKKGFLPTNDKDFARATRIFFGVNLHLKVLEATRSAGKTWGKEYIGHGRYEILEDHNFYCGTPHAKAMKKIMRKTGSPVWSHFGDDWSCYDYEGWVFNLLIGELYCGGIGRSNYGQIYVWNDEEMDRLNLFVEWRNGFKRIKDKIRGVRRVYEY